MTGFAWGLLFGAFFSVVLVIYWLTEKPKKHELSLPPIRKSRTVDVEPWGREVKLEPPAVIGTISENYDQLREPPVRIVHMHSDTNEGHSLCGTPGFSYTKGKKAVTCPGCLSKI